MDQKTADHSNEKTPELDSLRQHLQRLSQRLGESGPFCAVPDALIRTADEELPGFAGANGRYRYAKLLNPPKGVRAVLQVVPRYENTEMILEMRGTAEKCPVPYYNLALDGDWDHAAESRLSSFLYYIRSDIRSDI